MAAMGKPRRNGRFPGKVREIHGDLLEDRGTYPFVRLLASHNFKKVLFCWPWTPKQPVFRECKHGIPPFTWFTPP